MIGITLTTRRLGTERGSEYPILEVAASGTALVAHGTPTDNDPFTTGLSGSEILKLAAQGWAPLRYVVGIGHVRGVAGRGSRRALVSIKNGEVQQLSELRGKSLEIAIQGLERGVQPPGDLIVGVERSMAEQHLEVHTRLTGSAVRRLPPGREPGVLDVLRVVDLRR